MAKTYDQRQTELCDRLREHLQSIAVQTFAAQDLDPSCDVLAELLADIQHDVKMAIDINNKLNRDEVK